MDRKLLYFSLFFLLVAMVVADDDDEWEKHKVELIDFLSLRFFFFFFFNIQKSNFIFLMGNKGQIQQEI